MQRADHPRALAHWSRPTISARGWSARCKSPFHCPRHLIQQSALNLGWASRCEAGSNRGHNRSVTDRLHEERTDRRSSGMSAGSEPETKVHGVPAANNRRARGYVGPSGRLISRTAKSKGCSMAFVAAARLAAVTLTLRSPSARSHTANRRRAILHLQRSGPLAYAAREQLWPYPRGNLPGNRGFRGIVHRLGPLRLSATGVEPVTARIDSSGYPTIIDAL